MAAPVKPSSPPSSTLVIDQVRLTIAAPDALPLSVLRRVVVRSGTGRKRSDKRSPVPLLCLPEPLGSAAGLQPFIEQLQALPDAPRMVLAIDMRGRGQSARGDIDSYTSDQEADDLIAVCDALGLHHIDVLATAESAALALRIAPRRPSLIRKLVLHDGAPERDPVGIARMNQLHRLVGDAPNWDDAVQQLKQAYAKQFDRLDDRQWQEFAHMVWDEEQGRPSLPCDPELKERFHHVDLDARQYALWREFAMFARHDVMLIWGDSSPYITEEVVEKMKAAKPDIEMHRVAGQGHPPLLTTEELPQTIVAFLARVDQVTNDNDEEQGSAN